jgi:hypothetical protein
VVPVLAPHLDDLGLPSELRDLMAQVAQRQTLHTLNSASQLARLASAVTDAGIRTLVLKGIPLALRTSGDLACRHSSDIDLLVAPDDAAHAGDPHRSQFGRCSRAAMTTTSQPGSGSSTPTMHEDSTDSAV